GPPGRRGHRWRADGRPRLGPTRRPVSADVGPRRARVRPPTPGHKSLYVALEEVEAGLISWEVGAEVRQDGAGIGGAPMAGHD
ncbi:MAG: hypothetical protein AB7O37_17980, partial [Vicinamibacteria bacterium]